MALLGVVLAAGAGRRMRPLSDRRHKALLEVAGEPILDRIFRGLEGLGVEETVLVTGARAAQLETHVRERFPSHRVRFVRNEHHETTNNVVSLALALDVLAEERVSGDLVLLECDLVFHPALLQRLLGREGRNVALVDRFRPGMEGTAVAVGGGLLRRVFLPDLQGVGFDPADKYKTLNIYRFDQAFWRDRLRPAIRAQAAADGSAYYEVGLAMLVEREGERIEAEVVAGELWAEVDDPNDLVRARFVVDAAGRYDLLQRHHGGHWNFDLLDFAHLRNVFFPPPRMMSALQQALPQLVTNYTSSQDVLDSKVALLVGCDPARVRALSGASQAFPWLAEVLGCRHPLVPRPTFGEYARAFPQATAYADAPGVSWPEVEGRAGEADAVVFVNPNNPTGTVLDPESILAFAASRPGRAVLVDESFAGFAPGTSLIHRLEENPLANVIVLGSLSKVLGLPGARLGFVHTSDEQWREALSRRLPVWSLGSVAEHALELAVKFRPELARSIELTTRQRAAFGVALAACPAIEHVYPSGGNFLLVRLRCDAAEAGRLARALMAEHGILVKDVSGRIEGGAGHWRLAVRDATDNARLIAALAGRGSSRG